MSKPIEIFYKSLLEFIWAKQRTCLETRFQKTEKIVSKNESCSFFYAFGIKERM